jgi:hypothetical protein
MVTASRWIGSTSTAFDSRVPALGAGTTVAPTATSSRAFRILVKVIPIWRRAPALHDTGSVEEDERDASLAAPWPIPNLSQIPTLSVGT